MNNPEKLADTIVHLAHENARLSMEVSILKTEINILNDKLEAERGYASSLVKLVELKTNSNDGEWGGINIGDEFEDYEPYEHPDDDYFDFDEVKVREESCKGIKPVAYMVDPPSGWKYGFPKIYKCWPEEKEPPANLDWWLEKNGYPTYEINYWQQSPKSEYGCVPCRVWKHES